MRQGGDTSGSDAYKAEKVIVEITRCSFDQDFDADSYPFLTTQGYTVNPDVTINLIDPGGLRHCPFLPGESISNQKLNFADRDTQPIKIAAISQSAQIRVRWCVFSRIHVNSQTLSDPTSGGAVTIEIPLGHVELTDSWFLSCRMPEMPGNEGGGVSVRARNVGIHRVFGTECDARQGLFIATQVYP
jgi:hypothetical protein